MQAKQAMLNKPVSKPTLTPKASASTQVFSFLSVWIPGLIFFNDEQQYGSEGSENQINLILPNLAFLVIFFASEYTLR